ncbi:MAG: ABC transporter ATP-binding protein [Nitrospinales bacterium]
MFVNRLKTFLPFLAAYRREILIGCAALLLCDIAGLAIPWLLKTVIDLLPEKPQSRELIQYGGLLFLAAALQGLFRYGWRKKLFGPSRKVEFDILNRLFDHFLTLDRAFYQNQKIGDLMSRATNDLRAIRDFMGLGFLILMDAVVVIACCLALMIYINPTLTLYALLPLPLVTVLFYKFFGSVVVQHRIVQEHLAKITSMVQENLAGIRVLHAYVQEDHEKRKFDQLSREYLEKNMRLTKIFGLFTPSMVFVVGVAAMIALWIGGKAVIAGEMTLGSFVAFNGYLMMLSWPMMGIGYVFNLSQKGSSAMGRLQEIFSAQSRIADCRTGKSEIQGEIEFRGVQFTYPGKSDFGLRDINLKVERGSSVALLGMIGSGKTTLAQLVARMFDPSAGELLVDGLPIQDIPLSVLRRNIAYVDQEPYLFSTTIKNNIAFGADETGDEKIDEAVRLAGLAPDLSHFPQGLETLVGERGISLSGGQKQRIALARALIRKPKILILDDAFSSLDVETEEKILKNIRDYLKGVTAIIVTHRLSTIRNTDRIVVMDNGRIVETGSHSELVRGGAYYSQVFKNQMLAREMEILMK